MCYQKVKRGVWLETSTFEKNSHPVPEFQGTEVRSGEWPLSPWEIPKVSAFYRLPPGAWGPFTPGRNQEAARLRLSQEGHGAGNPGLTGPCGASPHGCLLACKRRRRVVQGTEETAGITGKEDPVSGETEGQTGPEDKTAEARGSGKPSRRESQATEKLRQRRKSRCLSQLTRAQKAPKDSGRSQPAHAGLPLPSTGSRPRRAPAFRPHPTHRTCPPRGAPGWPS